MSFGEGLESFKHPDQDEIVQMAMNITEAPIVATSLTDTGFFDGFGQARQMFVSIFVAQALSEVDSSLYRNKQAIADRAAAAAGEAVDAFRRSIAALKTHLGIG